MCNNLSADCGKPSDGQLAITKTATKKSVTKL